MKKTTLIRAMTYTCIPLGMPLWYSVDITNTQFKLITWCLYCKIDWQKAPIIRDESLPVESKFWNISHLAYLNRQRRCHNNYFLKRFKIVAFYMIVLFWSLLLLLNYLVHFIIIKIFILNIFFLFNIKQII